MAKIEMDLSEFKLMEENRKLLEESLDREKKLSEENKLLQEEKIKILKNASMSVSYIKRKIVQETKLQNRSDEEIHSSLMRMYDRERRGNNREHGYPGFGIMNSMVDYFFESKTIEYEGDVEVISRGLDEVRAEIKSDYVKELSKDTLEKLDKLKIVSKENANNHSELSKLKIVSNEFENQLTESKIRNEKLTEELMKINETIIDNYSLKEEIINLIKKQDFAFFETASTFKSKLILNIRNRVLNDLKINE